MQIPSPGESISEVEIAEWLVKDGDYVEKDQTIAEVDSDKATLDLPAEESGVITLKAKEGDAVEVGAVVCLIDTKAKPSSETVLEKPKIIETKEPINKNVDPTEKDDNSSFASGTPSPAAAKILSEKNISVTNVSGSGKGGRITKDDVHNFIKLRLRKSSNTTKQSSEMIMPSVDIPPFDNYGENSVRSMSKIQKITSLNMQKNWLNVPHVTQFDNADIILFDTPGMEKSIEFPKNLIGKIPKGEKYALAGSISNNNIENIAKLGVNFCDLSSSLELDTQIGYKDHQKIKKFIKKINEIKN